MRRKKEKKKLIKLFTPSAKFVFGCSIAAARIDIDTPRKEGKRNVFSKHIDLILNLNIPRNFFHRNCIASHRLEHISLPAPASLLPTSWNKNIFPIKQLAEKKSSIKKSTVYQQQIFSNSMLNGKRCVLNHPLRHPTHSTSTLKLFADSQVFVDVPALFSFLFRFFYYRTHFDVRLLSTSIFAFDSIAYLFVLVTFLGWLEK